LDILNRLQKVFLNAVITLGVVFLSTMLISVASEGFRDMLARNWPLAVIVLVFCVIGRGILDYFQVTDSQPAKRRRRY